jgi:hypothetical protein
MEFDPDCQEEIFGDILEGGMVFYASVFQCGLS